MLLVTAARQLGAAANTV